MYTDLIQEYKTIESIKREMSKINRSFVYLERTKNKKTTALEFRIRPDIWYKARPLIAIVGKSKLIRDVVLYSKDNTDTVPVESYQKWQRVSIRVDPVTKLICQYHKTPAGPVRKINNYVYWFNQQLLNFIHAYYNV